MEAHRFSQKRRPSFIESVYGILHRKLWPLRFLIYPSRLFVIASINIYITKQSCLKCLICERNLADGGYVEKCIRRQNLTNSQGYVNDDENTSDDENARNDEKQSSQSQWLPQERQATTRSKGATLAIPIPIADPFPQSFLSFQTRRQLLCFSPRRGD